MHACWLKEIGVTPQSHTSNLPPTPSESFEELFKCRTCKQFRHADYLLIFVPSYFDRHTRIAEYDKQSIRNDWKYQCVNCALEGYGDLEKCELCERWGAFPVDVRKIHGHELCKDCRPEYFARKEREEGDVEEEMDEDAAIFALEEL